MSSVEREKVKNHTTASVIPKKRRVKTKGYTRKYKAEPIDISTAKEKKALEEDYQELRQCIVDCTLERFKEIIANQDNKWYLENNDLDYELFCLAVIHSRGEFIRAMESMKYVLNPNMLLIEVYERFVRKKYKEDTSKIHKDTEHKIFSTENLKYLITNNYGLTSKDCLLEFYFLLMTLEYEPAIKLLSMQYANSLRDKLNEVFIGDENNLLEQILSNTDIVKEVISSALERHLDGVAFEIYTYSGIFMDERMLKCAVIGDCSFFLEEVWEVTRRFGNIKNYYAPKISFSNYITCMLNEGKFEMASDAIKNWFEAYKEENIFEILVDQNEELAM